MDSKDPSKSEPVSFLQLNPDTMARLRKYHERFVELSESDDDVSIDRFITHLLDWTSTDYPSEYGDLV